MTKQNRIKCTKDCLIVFWISILAMMLISGMKGHDVPEPTLIPEESIIIRQYYSQDTISEYSFIASPEVLK